MDGKFPKGRWLIIKDKKIKLVNWIGMYTLLSKEIKRFCKVYQQTILAPAFTAMLFFFVITVAISSKVQH